VVFWSFFVTTNARKSDNPFNIFTPGLIQMLRTKTGGLHVVLHRNFSGLVNVTDPVKSLKDSGSLVVCTWKKILWLGSADFL